MDGNRSLAGMVNLLLQAQPQKQDRSEELYEHSLLSPATGFKSISRQSVILALHRAMAILESNASPRPDTDIVRANGYRYNHRQRSDRPIHLRGDHRRNSALCTCGVG